MRLSSKWWTKYYLACAIGAILSCMPWTMRVLKWIAHRLLELHKLGADEISNLESIRRGRSGYADPTAEQSGFGYESGEDDLLTAIKYRKQIMTPGFETEASESHDLYKNQIEKANALIGEDSDIQEFVNFGVCYAHIDQVLARLNPGVDFMGIERSRLVMTYNKIMNHQRPNLMYFAEDIFNFIGRRLFPRGILFHSRILTLMPMQFLRKFYEAAHWCEFKYIMGFEPIGVSRQTNSVYEFSEDQRLSVLYRGPMYIHNYPGLLHHADYEIQESEEIKTRHPHEDYRIKYYLARRK